MNNMDCVNKRFIDHPDNKVVQSIFNYNYKSSQSNGFLVCVLERGQTGRPETGANYTRHAVHVDSFSLSPDQKLPCFFDAW